MTRAAFATAICFVLLTSTAFGQSVDGDWTTGLHARGPDGRTITLTLTSDGRTVTGTVYGVNPIPLEGTIAGRTLDITLTVTTSTGGELLVHYFAILEGDEMKFTFQSEDGRSPVFGPAAREFTATRVR